MFVEEKTETLTPTIFDKALASTFLKLVPPFVTPNAITVFRFLTLPFIAYLLWMGEYRSGLAWFVCAAFSDMVDGALARTRNQVTEWGKIFDPLADKLLIGITALILLVRFAHPLLALSILSIELILMASATYKRLALHLSVQAHPTGKIKMVLQCAGMFSILLYAVTLSPFWLFLGIPILYLAVFFGILSLFVYYSV